MKRLTTKEYIAVTFEELLQNNNFTAISVQDIVQASNISRTTFYRHFEDKYSLMNWIYLQRIDEIIKNNANIKNWKNLVLEVYSFIYSKREFFRKAIHYQGQNSLPDFIYSCSYKYCVKIMKEALAVTILPEDIDFSLRIYCGGTVHILKDWLISGAKQSPEKMTKFTCDNIPAYIQKYFE